MKGRYKHLFGPVPSRRLGRSLGVDLTPFKTCTLDCIFCQLGRTTHKTLDRREYVPIGEVEAELKAWKNVGGAADHVTLSGSGEPTLHSRFGDVLGMMREHTGLPAVLLSNGTLFSQPEVREAAKRADIVKLSLSAWDEKSFEHVNRPHADLKLERMVDGYRAFRRIFTGRLWIEVFLIWGTNSVARDVEKIALLLDSIRPDEIHLNTAVRPPAEEFAFGMPRKEMEGLTNFFRPPAKVIAEFSAEKSADVAANEDTILAMLRRRSCTAEEIASVFGMHMNELSKYLGKLLRTDSIQAKYVDGKVYYMANAHEEAVHADV